MAKPFIKYPGGKRDHVVINTIIRHRPHFFDTFIEPMVGAGGVFFSLQEAQFLDGVMTILGDADADLIKLYAAIRKNPHRVYKQAKEEADHIAGYETEKEQKHAYNALRQLWNLDDRKPGYQLCLRHACYNGVFRNNKKGEMNMPPRDKLEKLTVPKVPELLECAQALEGVELLDWDFRQYEDRLFIGPGTLIYLDPPYHGEGGFRAYTAEGFDDHDQVELIRQAAEWHDRGATVIYSNANTPFIVAQVEKHWPEGAISYIEAKRTVSCDGDTRAPAPEVIVCGTVDP